MMIFAIFLITWVLGVLILRRWHLRLTLNWFYFILILSTICYVIGGSR
jgi:hypothetical protein